MSDLSALWESLVTEAVTNLAFTCLLGRIHLVGVSPEDFGRRVKVTITTSVTFLWIVFNFFFPRYGRKGEEEKKKKGEEGRGREKKGEEGG